jgi:hypothetical protein
LRPRIWAYSVARVGVDRLRLHDCNGKIASIPEQVVQTLLWPAFHLVAGDDNPAIGKTLLFAYLVVGPARGIEVRQDVPATGISFGELRH